MCLGFPESKREINNRFVVVALADCSFSYLVANGPNGVPLQSIVVVHVGVDSRLLRAIVTPVAPSQNADESTRAHEKNTVGNESFAIDRIVAHIQPLPYAFTVFFRSFFWHCPTVCLSLYIAPQCEHLYIGLTFIPIRLRYPSSCRPIVCSVRGLETSPPHYPGGDLPPHPNSPGVQRR